MTEWSVWVFPWSEDARIDRPEIRWVSPVGAGRFAQPDPGPDDLSLRVGDLQHGSLRRGLEGALHRDVSEAFRRWLNPRHTLRLKLCGIPGNAGLPDRWQRFPFEWIIENNENNETLHGRLVVERYAAWTPDTEKERKKRTAEPSVAKEQPIEAISLLKTNELTIAMKAIFCHCSVCQGRDRAQQFFKDIDLTLSSALIVNAHGSEKPTGPRFLDERGDPWDLPDKPMPPLVVLAACGTLEGNLIALGSQLLARGAKAVLAPLGKIGIEETGTFLDQLSKAWMKNVPVGEILRKAQKTDTSELGVRRFCLLGDGDLRLRGPSIPVQALSNEELNSRIENGEDANALAERVNRITVESHLQGGGYGKVFNMARQSSGVKQDENDPSPQRRFLCNLENAWNVESIWPATRMWLNYFALRLGDNLGARIAEVPRWQEKLKSIRSDVIAQVPIFHHAQGKADFGQGRYALAVREFAAGMACAAAERDQVSVQLLTGFHSVLIDMNLPGLAQKLDRQIATRINRLERNDQNWEELKFLDQQGRRTMRLGSLPGASSFFRSRLKRMENLRIDPKQELARELSIVLYCDSWNGRVDAGHLERARAYLAKLPAGKPSPGETVSGEEAYMTRALALHGWKTRNRESLDIVVARRERWENMRDIGPKGLTVLFLLLAGGRDLPWDAMAQELASNKYDLELTAAWALLGDSDHATQCLENFHSLRDGVIEALKRANPSLPDFTSDVIDDAVSDRVALERGALEKAADLKCAFERADHLIAAGMVPI